MKALRDLWTSKGFRKFTSRWGATKHFRGHWEGGIGGTEVIHLSWFLDIAERHGVMVTWQKESRALPRSPILRPRGGPRDCAHDKPLCDSETHSSIETSS